RGWTGRDFYSAPEVSAHSRETGTSPEGRPHLGWDERRHLAVWSDAPLRRRPTHRARLKWPRPKQNASHLLRSTSLHRLCDRPAAPPQSASGFKIAQIGVMHPAGHAELLHDTAG